MEQSLPSASYLTDAAWQAEREAIFAREWVCAARAEDVAEPGNHALVEVTGESILIVRTREGDIRAHYNVCRHRGARLCDAGNDARWGVELNGGVIGNVIRCPYHGWSYGLDGALLAAPNLGGEIDKAEFSLHPVGVAEWGGFVWLNLTPETAPDWVAPVESVQVTFLPISPLAPNAIWAESSLAVWSATSCIFSSAVNCADCARNWLESVGFDGSW